MKIREYQLAELDEARRLQDELAKLHVPSPVLSWRYEITDENGEVTERGIGKSNSYTRNTLNALAYYVGFADYHIASATIFADGSLSKKIINGTISTINVESSYSAMRQYNANPSLRVGINAAEESLDSYAAITSGLTIGGQSVSSTFNTSTRKLITIISGSFYNETAAEIDIVESGVQMVGYNGVTHLALRDVFSPIAVAPGATLNWTYVTEIAYPNP